MRYTMETCPPPSSCHAGILTALRIALKFKHLVPLPSELMRDYGMSRATAYRWVAAAKVAGVAE